MAHGKNQRIYIETTPGGGTLPPASTPVGFTKLSGYSVRQTFGKALADANEFGDNNELFESGLLNGSVSSSLRMKRAQLQVLLACQNSDTPIYFIHRAEGDASGNFQFFGQYHIDSVEVTGDTGSTVDANVTLRRHGAYQYLAIP